MAKRPRTAEQKANRKDYTFTCHADGCTKTIKPGDSRITISVSTKGSTQEVRRFCCLEHSSEWMIKRVNYGIRQKIVSRINKPLKR